MQERQQQFWWGMSVVLVCLLLLLLPKLRDTLLSATAVHSEVQSVQLVESVAQLPTVQCCSVLQTLDRHLCQQQKISIEQELTG